MTLEDLGDVVAPVIKKLKERKVLKEGKWVIDSGQLTDVERKQQELIVAINLALHKQFPDLAKHRLPKSAVISVEAEDLTQQLQLLTIPATE